jgi:transcriptional regulator with XRE-family HTH domain
LADSIGARIKGLRSEQRLTLADLGDRTGLSTSYLSQLERDKTTPSLVTLTAVAKAFSVSLRYFFETGGEAAFIVRAEHVLNGSGRGLAATSQLLAPEGVNKLSVQRIVVAPHSSSEQLAGVQAEALVFVLAGELKLVVGTEEFYLAAGDSVHFDASQPHCWSNESDTPCTVIWSRALTQIER